MEADFNGNGTKEVAKKKRNYRRKVKLSVTPSSTRVQHPQSTAFNLELSTNSIKIHPMLHSEAPT